MTAIRELDFHLELYTDEKEIKLKIDELLSAYEPEYDRTARYQSGKWDGKKRFYVFNNPVFIIPKGFKDKLLKNIKFDSIELLKNPDISNLNIFLKNIFLELPFKPRKYQIEAFINIVNNWNHLPIISTGGGKSLVAYLVLRYFWENNLTCILIVPTIGLVDQMFNDFKDYLAPLKFLSNIQLIGGEYKNKELTKPIIISTWQSLSKIENIENYDVYFVDECHKLKADVLQEIMSKKVKRKYGMTGSFPLIPYEQLLIEQVTGEPKIYANARSLIEKGLLTETKIIALFLNYPRSDTRSNFKYKEEVKFVQDYVPRLNFINKFLKSLHGVTIALYQNTNHGEKIYEKLTGIKLTHKKKSDFDMMKKLGVFFISGATKSDVREKIRLYLNEVQDAIVIGQFSVLSTGINIPKLKNLVFLANTKSFTLVLQSIGRVMRKHKEKGNTVYVFDLVDSFDYAKENYLLNHFWQRDAYYRNEGHPVLEKEIDLEKYK